MPESQKKTFRKKYTTPCDSCAISKKCDLNSPCSRFLKQTNDCTFRRFKKFLKSNLEKGFVENQFNDGEECAKYLGAKEQIIPVEKLIPFCQIYKVWYYGNWPIFSSDDLMSRLTKLKPTFKTLATN